MAQWLVAAKRADFQGIADRYKIDPVIARLIRNRDVIGDDAIWKYLKGGKEDLHEPLLLKDMDKAVRILKEKIASGAGIRIIGDYDADGICASHILLRGLTECGAKADTVIPHRVKDGYGLNEALLEEAASEGVDTVVTCDNGIAAAAQIAYGKRLGLTIIVTDHHEIPYEEDGEGNRRYLLPKAAAVVDPKREDCDYPCKNICGAVVAYKLAQQLLAECGKADITDELLEIAAFATVCDLMELKDENRIIVKCGLENMRHTRNFGLRALMDACGIEPGKLSAYHIGFVLGPCMNATGRLDTAKRALELLQSSQKAEAARLAAELKDLNDIRKEMTVKGTEEAVAFIESRRMQKDRVLVVYLPKVHESLAGIIAGRIREKYGKPAFVLTKGEEGVKGSGRSIENYHMYEEMTRCKECFIKYGGHKMAAGLSMEEKDVDVFREKINQECRLTKEDLEEKIHIDVAMPLSYITKELIRELELLEPFGVGNGKPVFAQKDVHILSGRIIGKNRNVGKYSVTDGSGYCYDMVYFGDLEAFHGFLAEKAGEPMVNRLYSGERADIPVSIIYYPDINQYGGKESIQIVMRGYR